MSADACVVACRWNYEGTGGRPAECLQTNAGVASTFRESGSGDPGTPQDLCRSPFLAGIESIPCHDKGPSMHAGISDGRWKHFQKAGEEAFSIELGEQDLHRVREQSPHPVERLLQTVPREQFHEQCLATAFISNAP